MIAQRSSLLPGAGLQHSDCRPQYKVGTDLQLSQPDGSDGAHNNCGARFQASTAGSEGRHSAPPLAQLSPQPGGADEASQAVTIALSVDLLSGQALPPAGRSTDSNCEAPGPLLPPQPKQGAGAAQHPLVLTDTAHEAPGSRADLDITQPLSARPPAAPGTASLPQNQAALASSSAARAAVRSRAPLPPPPMFARYSSSLPCSSWDVHVAACSQTRAVLSLRRWVR